MWPVPRAGDSLMGSSNTCGMSVAIEMPSTSTACAVDSNHLIQHRTSF